MGFVGLALGAMLHRDGSSAPIGFRAGAADGRPHFPPRAKRVIWLMMRGGVSHLESFDPKPEMTKHAGKTISRVPHKATVFDSPFLKNVREQVANNIIDKTEGQDLSDADRLQERGAERHRGQRLVAARARAASTTSP